jgi:hypothetical protein
MLRRTANMFLKKNFRANMCILGNRRLKAANANKFLFIQVIFTRMIVSSCLGKTDFYIIRGQLLLPR